MRFLSKATDGGPESNVTGYWLVEIKGLFSIALLKFEHGSREAFHSHAFNCLSWIVKGAGLREEHINGEVDYHFAGPDVILTKRDTFHRVYSLGTNWVFTIRGPWSRYWFEYSPDTSRLALLKDGRKVIEELIL